MDMDNSIYIALDFPDWHETEQFLSRHRFTQAPVKVGMELFYREGPDVIKRLNDRGHAVFLDLKLHDIPTTIYKAMKNIAKLNVVLTNVHGLGGSEMVKAAKQGLLDGTEGQQTPKLLAVTLLTSIDQTVVNHELQIPNTLENIVVDLAKLAQNNGADGVVCSAHEAPKLKAACGQSFLAVTPGIRLTDTASNDQKRVATPAFAKEKGADALVIGRSITAANDPKANYLAALKEWQDDKLS